MTRAILGSLALSACCVLTLHASEPAQPRLKAPIIPQQKGPNQVDPDMPFFIVCAEACDDCARMCEMCAAHCARLLAKGNKEHHITLRMCQDCAAICQGAARVCAKDGPMLKRIVATCADACKECGDVCAKHLDDPMIKKCAEECRKCEKICRAMVKGETKNANSRK